MWGRAAAGPVVRRRLFGARRLEVRIGATNPGSVTSCAPPAAGAAAGHHQGNSHRDRHNGESENGNQQCRGIGRA